MRYLGTITLLFFLAGCTPSAYVGVPFVQSEPTTNEPIEEYPALSPGSNIRLTLRDDRVVKARFQKFEDHAVVISEARLEGSDRDDFNEIQQTETMTTDKQYKIKLADVTLLEKSTSGGTNDSAGTIAAVGLIVSLVFVLATPSVLMD